MMATLAPPWESIGFRSMAEADIPAIRTLHAESFAALARDWHTEEQIAGHVALIYDAAYVEDLLRSHVTLACDGQGILATAGWLAVADEPGTARIRKVFVHPHMARRGLGSAMVRHAEQQARAAGYDRLIVRANINAVGLYTKLGYAIVSEGTMPVGLGVELPVVMMEKLP